MTEIFPSYWIGALIKLSLTFLNLYVWLFGQSRLWRLSSQACYRSSKFYRSNSLKSIASGFIVDSSQDCDRWARLWIVLRLLSPSSVTLSSFLAWPTPLPRVDSNCRWDDFCVCTMWFLFARLTVFYFAARRFPPSLGALPAWTVFPLLKLDGFAGLPSPESWAVCGRHIWSFSTDGWSWHEYSTPFCFSSEVTRLSSKREAWFVDLWLLFFEIVNLATNCISFWLLVTGFASLRPDFDDSRTFELSFASVCGAFDSAREWGFVDLCLDGITPVALWFEM